jgi:hypothetical protein
VLFEVVEDGGCEWYVAGQADDERVLGGHGGRHPAAAVDRGRHPEMLLTGPALRDQGRIVTLMLDAGWSPEQLRHVITSRPLPSQICTSVDAIVAARLCAARTYPPPAACADDAAPAEPPLAPERSTTAPADRPVSQALNYYRALVECAGCGVPGNRPR